MVIKKMAVLLALTCLSEARDWHIWVIKYEDVLLMNHASKMFSDHVKTVCVCGDCQVVSLCV